MMRRFGIAAVSAPSDSITTSLIRFAPWLPPKISSVGVETGGLDLMLKNSRLTGTPVTLQLRKYLHVSLNCTAAAATAGPSRRFANPGTTFGSNATLGTPIAAAANIAGPEA